MQKPRPDAGAFASGQQNGQVNTAGCHQFSNCLQIFPLDAGQHPADFAFLTTDIGPCSPDIALLTANMGQTISGRDTGMNMALLLP